MNIKITEILVSDITRDTFVKKWNQLETTSKNNKIKGVTHKFNVNLRVPLRVKGSATYLLIYSKLVVLDKNNGVLIGFYTNINKPLIFSLLVGVIPSILFLYLYSSVFVFIIFSILISISCLTMLYLKLYKLSTKYLSKLKEKFN